MKVLIESQFDLVGDEYMDQEEIVAEVFVVGEELVIRIDDKQYFIPLTVIKVEELSAEKRRTNKLLN